MSKKIVILTGAGISAESGIKTFRGANGLWENHPVEEVASPVGWERNMELVLDFYNQRRQQLVKCQPNKAHFALVELERQYDVVVITQNVDDLHERAGSKKVIHLHGELLKMRSSVDENLVFDCLNDIAVGDKCPKGSQMRPHIVWFGESVPRMEDAILEVSTATKVIVIGTSLSVYPAAGLLNYATPESSKWLIDPDTIYVPPVANLEFIQKKATEGVPELAHQLLQNENCVI